MRNPFVSNKITLEEAASKIVWAKWTSDYYAISKEFMKRDYEEELERLKNEMRWRSLPYKINSYLFKLKRWWKSARKK